MRSLRPRPITSRRSKPVPLNTTSPAQQADDDLAVMECRLWWGRAYREDRLMCGCVGVAVIGDVRLGVGPIRHRRVQVQFLEPIHATLRDELQRLLAVRGARGKRFAQALVPIEIAWSDPAGSHCVLGQLEPPVTHRHLPLEDAVFPMRGSECAPNGRGQAGGLGMDAEPSDGRVGDGSLPLHSTALSQ